MKKIKFKQFIKNIEKNFFKQDTYLFIRKKTQDINLIIKILKNKVLVIEISNSKWEEVFWDKNDNEYIFLCSVKNIIKNYEK